MNNRDSHIYSTIIRTRRTIRMGDGDLVTEGTMAEGHDEHRAFREQVTREHEERLTGYRALLVRIESAAAGVQMAADT